VLTYSAPVEATGMWSRVMIGTISFIFLEIPNPALICWLLAVGFWPLANAEQLTAKTKKNQPRVLTRWFGD
jgi:hypothetical protein